MAVSALMNLIVMYALLSSTKAFWDPCGSPLGGICSAIEDIKSWVGSGCPQRETITWHYGICANEGGQCTAPYLGAFMWYGTADSKSLSFPAYKVELKPNQVMGCNDNDFGCDPNVLSGARGTKYCWMKFKLPLVDKGNPQPYGKCHCLNECEGDCDGDDDCKGDLKCYHRTNDGTGNIPPFCVGSAHYTSHDYCYDPVGSGLQDPVPLVPEDKPAGFWTMEYVFNVKDVGIIALAAINLIMMIIVVIVCKRSSARIKYQPVTVDSDIEVMNS